MADSLKNSPICVFPSIASNPSTSYSSPSIDAVRFPITNLADRKHQLRVYRAGGGGTKTIALEIPTNSYFGGIVITNTNWNGSVGLYSVNSNNTSETPMAMDGGAVSTVFDRRTGRYHCFIRTDEDDGVQFDGSTKKFARVKFLSGNLAFGSDLQIGAATPFTVSDMKAFPGGFSDKVSYEIINPIIESKMEYGGSDEVEAGDLSVQIDVSDLDIIANSYDLIGVSDQADQGDNIFNMIRRRTGSFVYYENDEDAKVPYVVRLAEKSFKVAYKAKYKVFKTGFSMIECI